MKAIILFIFSTAALFAAEQKESTPVVPKAKNQQTTKAEGQKKEERKKAPDKFFKNSPFAGKPLLFYFSSPGCPACRYFDPVMDQIEKEYKEKVKVQRFEKMSTERLEMMSYFIPFVDVQAIPFTVLTNSQGRVLYFTQGHRSYSTFKQELEVGLDKAKNLPNMKLDKLLFICRFSYKPCQSMQQELSQWEQEYAQDKVAIESVDLDKFETREEFSKLSNRLTSLKYIYDMNGRAPALFALSSKEEVISILQMYFSKDYLNTQFQGLY